MSETFTIKIDGRECVALQGETVLQVARREGIQIPTLCDDKRLDPAGACRACLVEIDGQRRLQPSCAWKAADGQNVKTHQSSPRVQRHQDVLVSLYMSDHKLDEQGLPVETPNGNDLRAWAKDCSTLKLDPVNAPRVARPGDKNPYIHFDPELCVLCARCTRYCDEVEAVNAITLTNRGSETTIGTAGMRGLLDTSCELCGGCVDTCPTGALIEKKSPKTLPEQVTKVRTTCNYCGVGCQMDLNVDRSANGGRGKVVKITSPPPGTTTNDGNLCVKGRFAYEFVEHADRLTVPLVREGGALREATWEEALQRAAAGLRGVAARHGADGLGFVSSSRCTMEENYLVQKLSRAVFHTNNVHQCAAT